MKKCKVVIVGASSGIGRALAEALASRGVEVGIAARNEEKLKELAGLYPSTIVYEKIDIDSYDAGRLLRRLVEKLGGMDIYVHAAGIGYANPDFNPEFEVSCVETDTVGFVRMVSEAYNILRDTEGRRQLVAISSVAGTKGIGDMAAYSASKRFDSTYLTALRQKANMEKSGVSITDIRPGWVRTPLLEDDKHYPLEMNVQEVVAGILRAIVRKSSVAVIDWRWNIVVRLWSLIPESLWVRIPYRI